MRYFLGTGDTAVNKRDKTPYPCDVYTLVEGDTTKNLSDSNKCHREK